MTGRAAGSLRGKSGMGAGALDFQLQPWTGGTGY